MKIQVCCYACDDCDAESEPATTFKEAARLARRDGWRIQGDGTSYCPDHNYPHGVTQ